VVGVPTPGSYGADPSRGPASPDGRGSEPPTSHHPLPTSNRGRRPLAQSPFVFGPVSGLVKPVGGHYLGNYSFWIEKVGRSHRHTQSLVEAAIGTCRLSVGPVVGEDRKHEALIFCPPPIGSDAVTGDHKHSGATRLEPCEVISQRAELSLASPGKCPRYEDHHGIRPGQIGQGSDLAILVTQGEARCSLTDLN
jgi:hypothetical protein